jgi:signal transduction histidine kinase
VAASRERPAGEADDGFYVSVRRHGKAATVEVADTGCGVEESHLPLLFDRFFRAAPSDVEGSGLGLAIVEAIAKRHGLAVKLENRRDRPGLVARVSFPVEISKGVIDGTTNLEIDLDGQSLKDLRVLPGLILALRDLV